MKTITDLEHAAFAANYILNTKGGVVSERNGKFEVYGEESGGPEERLACESSEESAIDAAATYLERIVAETAVPKIKYEIDEAAMGGEWNGSESLDTFSEILQEKLGDEYEVVTITDMYNGAKNRDENGDIIDIDESIWLAALDEHAKKYPTAWSC